MKSYLIPKNVTTILNLNTTFMIINNEFYSQTSLSGFILYGALNGSIKIQVRILNKIKNKIKSLFQIKKIIFLRLFLQMYVG